MPDAECARGGAQHREIGEHSADNGSDQTRARPQAPLDFRSDLLLVIEDLGHRRIADVVRAKTDHDVAVAGGHRAPSPRGRPRAERRLDCRKMAPFHMIEIAAKVFGGELPVARHYPLIGADNLDAPLAAVEKRIQIPGHFPEIFAQRRRLRVKGGKQQSLVAVQLRHWGEPPALALQFAVIGFLEVRDPDQSPVMQYVQP